MKPVCLLAVALVVCACTDRAPISSALELAPPQASLIGGLLGAVGLLQCTDLSYASATQTIRSAGGTIRVGPHTLTVPAGALASPVAITGEIVTGRGVNAVDFPPDGLRFARSASLTMSYANCNLLGKLLPKRIAYTTDELEILSYLLSLDNARQEGHRAGRSFLQLRGRLVTNA
ncbi:MAG TPA: hypothetical protein VEK86_04680 [Gemmatimonadales bacterium]|nr:hypothetical protein [Gemmatimonadales bacterium]